MMVQIPTKGLRERIIASGNSNKDLTPLLQSERTITPVGLGLTWFGLCVTLAAFMMFGAFMEWLTVGEAMIAGLIGFTILAVIQTATQELGIVYGVSYPTGSRAHLGVNGSKFVAIIKVPSTTFWGGFNVFLGGSALNEIFKVIGFDMLWLAMGIFAVLCVLLVFKGVAILNKFAYFASPIMLLMFTYIGFLLFRDSGYTVFDILSQGGDSDIPLFMKMSKFGLCIVAAMGLWLGLSLAMPNITRECKGDPKLYNSWWKTNKSFAFAEWLGEAPIMLTLGFLGASSMVLTGGLNNPITVIAQTVGDESITIMVICQAFIILAILTTNGGANILPPALLLCNIFKKVSLPLMSFIIMAVAIVLRPWALSGVLPQVVSILGGIQAPLAGMIITDYFLIRRRRLELEELYKPMGKYRYWKGINPAAIIAYSVTVFFMHLGPLRSYSIFIGIILSSVLYYLLMKKWIFKKYPESQEDITARFPDSLEEAEARDAQINAELGIKIVTNK